MTIHDFLYNLSTFDGRAYKQKELYANLVLNPNQSIKELQKILNCNSKNFKQLYDNLLKKGLKIEPIDEIEENLKSRISNIEKEQNSKIAAQEKILKEKKDKIVIGENDYLVQQPIQIKYLDNFKNYPLVNTIYNNIPITIGIKNGKINVFTTPADSLKREDIDKFCGYDFYEGGIEDENGNITQVKISDKVISYKEWLKKFCNVDL